MILRNAATVVYKVWIQYRGEKLPDNFYDFLLMTVAKEFNLDISELEEMVHAVIGENRK